MNARINSVQVIKDDDGSPQFVVLPYRDYLNLKTKFDVQTPHAVVKAVVGGLTPAKAWRQYLGLSQEEVASRMGISQTGYSQHETKPVNKQSASIRQRIADALGITLDQYLF